MKETKEDLMEQIAFYKAILKGYKKITEIRKKK